jgi:hypothetical protein
MFSTVTSFCGELSLAGIASKLIGIIKPYKMRNHIVIIFMNILYTQALIYL